MAYDGWTINLTEGSGFKVPLTFQDEDNAPVNLAGATIRFIINGGQHEWSTTNGKVTVTGPGTAQLALAAAGVAALDFDYGDYEWRIVWSDDTSVSISAGF